MFPDKLRSTPIFPKFDKLQSLKHCLAQTSVSLFQMKAAFSKTLLSVRAFFGSTRQTRLQVVRGCQRKTINTFKINFTHCAAARTSSSARSPLQMSKSRVHCIPILTSGEQKCTDKTTFQSQTGLAASKACVPYRRNRKQVLSAHKFCTPQTSCFGFVRRIIESKFCTRQSTHRTMEVHSADFWPLAQLARRCLHSACFVIQ